MEIKINGTPKEIADLVVAIQSQQLSEKLNCIEKNTVDILSIKKKFSDVLSNVSNEMIHTLQCIVEDYCKMKLDNPRQHKY